VKLEVTVHVHHSVAPQVAATLATLLKLTEQILKGNHTIMGKIDDATARAEALAARAEKVQAEVLAATQAARDEIQALKDQLANGAEPDTTALEAALSRAEAAVGATDDVNPDAAAG
jgi:hypothetical protein